jgi:hypothetical protein
MRLLDILKDLTYGELSGLAIGNLIPGEFDNEPDPHEYEQVISYINLGLKEIYKRFFLRSRELDIQQHEEITTYKLSSDYAASNTASLIPLADRYILDTVDDPFLDDILKIEEIYDEEGTKLPMNDITEENSVYTPSYRMVQIPYPNNDATFSVQYRAAHPKIPVTLDTLPDDVEIELPNSLHAALLQYVGYRANLRSNSEKSADYWQQFEKTCAHVENQGLEVQGEPGDWRFDEHGWV